MKPNHEIFEHWWEYFIVIWWGFSNPTNENFLKRIKPSKNVIFKEYMGAVTNLLKSNKTQLINEYKLAVTQSFSMEENRKDLIESKAHSLLGQTGITVSLLLGAFSIALTQSFYWSLTIKFIVWIFFVITIIHFTVSGLHARNAVVLKDGYEQADLREILDPHFTLNRLFLSRMYQIEHNSYLNDVKATYLKCAHWYFKAGLVSLVVGILLIIPIFFLLISKNDDKIESIKTNIINRIEKHELNVSKDSLNSRITLPIDSIKSEKMTIKK